MNPPTIQRVTSAPILIYDTTTTPTTTMRQHFYSIPATKALTTPLTITSTLAAKPIYTPKATQPRTLRTRATTAPRTITATLTAPRARATALTTTITPRFAEILQNTRQTSLAFNTTKITTTPMTTTTIVGSQRITNTPKGFYTARIIDQQERVAYADPIYIP